MSGYVFVRLRPGQWVRADQVAAVTEDGHGWAVLTLLSGQQIGAPELTARKVLNRLIGEVARANAAPSAATEETP